jgi:hypothetical protein
MIQQVILFLATCAAAHNTTAPAGASAGAVAGVSAAFVVVVFFCIAIFFAVMRSRRVNPEQSGPPDPVEKQKWKSLIDTFGTKMDRGLTMVAVDIDHEIIDFDYSSQLLVEERRCRCSIHHDWSESLAELSAQIRKGFLSPSLFDLLVEEEENQRRELCEIEAVMFQSALGFENDSWKVVVMSQLSRSVRLRHRDVQ